MDMDSARNKLVINGYEHPESSMYSRDKRYKTFNADTKTKITDMNLVKGQNAGRLYLAETEKADTDFCPVCKLGAKVTCNCVYCDKTCPNGHIWYTDRDGLAAVGNPHK